MRIVASLTTLPGRVWGLGVMVDSVLRQTRRPDRFVLQLPEICRRTGESYPVVGGFPDGLEVRRCGCDWGPATKLVGALEDEHEPGTAIVTLDDDVEYAPCLLADLERWAEELPKSVVGMVGGSMFGGYSKLTHGEEIDVPQAVGGLGGYRGVLYRRWMFDLEQVRAELSELWAEGPFLADDTYFTSWLERHGIPRRVVPPSWKPGGNVAGVGFLKRSDSIYLGPGAGGEAIEASEKLMARKHAEWLAGAKA